MAKSEKSVEELVSMIERGELRLPEMQRLKRTAGRLPLETSSNDE